MSLSGSTLVTYYECIDSGDLDGGLSLLSPEVSFAIILPGTVVRGENREGVRDYLNGRGPVERQHDRTQASREGQLAFVYGAVVEYGITITCHFLATALIDVDGLIAGIQVALDTELGLASPTL